jgi:hypothetical protein
MRSAMYLVQLLLPLYDNANVRFPRETFDHVRQELTDRFGGVTAFLRSPGEGFWRIAENAINRDDVVIFEVMAEQLDRPWWARYREDLERRFRQIELVIRASSIERL